jgi:serine/threonine protein phosphatase PrpC
MADWRAGAADASSGASCPSCGDTVLPDDHFCEACGATLVPGAPAASGPFSPPGSLAPGADGHGAAAPPMAGHPGSTATPTGVPHGVMPPGMGPPGAVPPGAAAGLAWAAEVPSCPTCGASAAELGPGGYCARCGHRWSPLRAHDEVIDGPAAAVTDRGLSHWRNEDAVGIRRIEGRDGRPAGFVMVVCDGVSVSQEPQLVSQTAAETALAVLCQTVPAGGPLDVAMVEATAAAQQAAAAVPYDPTLELGPGACTIVAAAVRGHQAAFASVGDSRAYWVDDEGALQIGNDDSLAGALVASGRFTVQQAMASAGAHALTKWLGVDSVDAAPTVTTVELLGPGLVVLASDGLWNYAPDPDDLARLIGPVGAEAPLDLARRLAGFAVHAGGADNITVAVGRHDLDPTTRTFGQPLQRGQLGPVGRPGPTGRAGDHGHPGPLGLRGRSGQRGQEEVR